MGDGAASQLSDAMNRLWEKFLPQMEGRVATLEDAAARLAVARVHVHRRGRRRTSACVDVATR